MLSHKAEKLQVCIREELAAGVVLSRQWKEKMLHALVQARGNLLDIGIKGHGRTRLASLIVGYKKRTTI